MRNLSPLFSLALLAAAALSLRAADGRIPISAVPFTISAPGHYYLTQSLTLASGIAIQINSGQVTLDLGGNTLTHQSIASGNNVINSSGGFNGIRITGGTVVGGFNGIALSGTSGGDYQVDHLRMTNNGNFGIQLTSNLAAIPPTHAVVDSVQVVQASGVGPYCIYLQNVSAGRVAHSSARNCSYGIRLNASRGVIVDDNSVSDSSYGIYLASNSLDNIITRNTVARNTNSGIFINGGSQNLVTFNNVTENNTGIYLNASGMNTINDNHTSGNSYGIFLTNADGNTLARNTSSGNTVAPGTGIYLQSGSTGNVLEGNIASGNTAAGINISDAASTGNIYKNNSLPGNGAVNNFGAGNQSGGGNCNGTTCS